MLESGCKMHVVCAMCSFCMLLQSESRISVVYIISAESRRRENGWRWSCFWAVYLDRTHVIFRLCLINYWINGDGLISHWTHFRNGTVIRWWLEC